MSRWFRHYAGMMRDEKLVAVAIRSKQPVERVVWVWGAILESASEIDDAGRFEFDPCEAAYFLRTDEADICAVLAALASSGRVAESCVVKWSERQYQSDKSADRQARYRARKRQGDGGSDDRKEFGDATTPSRNGAVTPPDTDTEEESTIANAMDADLASLAPVYADAKHELWGEGPPLLESLGIASSRIRPMIGRWCRDARDDCGVVLGAIRRARDGRVQEPVSWITRAIATESSHDRNRQSRPKSGADTILAAARRLSGDDGWGGGRTPDAAGGIDAHRDGSGVYRLDARTA